MMNGVPVEGYSQPLCWRMDPEHSYSDWTIEVVRTGPGPGPGQRDDTGSRSCCSSSSNNNNRNRNNNRNNNDTHFAAAHDSLRGSLRGQVNVDESSPVVDTYHVHRSVLAIGPHRSAYFLGAFRQKVMKESSERKSRICLTDHEADSMPHILDCLYKGPAAYFEGLKGRESGGSANADGDGDGNGSEESSSPGSIPTFQVYALMQLFDYFCMQDSKEKLVEYMESIPAEAVSAKEIPDLMCGLEMNNVMLQNWCLKKLHMLAFEAATRGKQEDHQILIATTKRLHRIVEFALGEKLKKKGEGGDNENDKKVGFEESSNAEADGQGVDECKSQEKNHDDEDENKRRERLNERRETSQIFVTGTSPAFLATKEIVSLLVSGIEQSKDCEENLLFIFRTIERICQGSDDTRDMFLEANIMAPVAFFLQSTMDMTFTLREKVSSVYKVLFQSKHRRPKLDHLFPAFPGAWRLMFDDDVWFCVRVAARAFVNAICDRPEADRKRLIDLGLCTKIGELILDPPRIAPIESEVPVVLPGKVAITKKKKMPKKQEIESKGVFYTVDTEDVANTEGKAVKVVAFGESDMGTDVDMDIDIDIDTVFDDSEKNVAPEQQKGPISDADMSKLASLLHEHRSTPLGDSARRVALYLASHEETDAGKVFTKFADHFIPAPVCLMHRTLPTVTLSQFVQWMSLISSRGTEDHFREYMGCSKCRVVRYLMMGIDCLRDGGGVEKRNIVAMSLNILVKMLAIDAEDHKGSRKRKWRVHTLMKEQSRDNDLVELEDLVKMTDYTDLAHCSAAILKKYFRRSRGVKRKRAASARPIRAVVNEDFETFDFE